ncbi:WD40-repeat-containing domain protein [Lipomyces tetrasporus]|uniref:WD40-repeat-containing domain protein n=1 Tax=Lipomyces tetrasporus TaxID=54092 RepID=A0AAD7QKL5_9ASCO|nr:WD40-repeat-containing domain protein [Lipomyces tetrasporus]KAJ8096809.1 WD40-repeat-containing domain protein [Lipomyces tetrasporus]
MVPTATSATLKTAFSHSAIEVFFTGGSASVSEDQSLLATAYGEEVVITDLSTGQRKHKFKGDTEQVTTLALSPDGKYVVVCSRSLQMRIFQLPECKLVRAFKAHDGPVIVMHIDSTSTLVATGAADGVVKVWDLAGGFNTHTFRGHTGVISAVRIFGQKGGVRWQVASGSDDTKIRIWDLVKRKCVAVLEDGHVSVVRGLDFSSDGSLLISGGRDKVVNVWNMENYSLVKTILVFEALETAGLLSSGTLTSKVSDQLIYTGGEKGDVKLWSIDSGEEVTPEHATIQTSEEVGVSDIIYYPSWNDLIAVLSDQTLVEHTLTSNDLPIVRRLSGNNGEVIDLAYVGPVDVQGIQKYLALATNSPEVRVISTETQSSVVLAAHTDIVICIDASIDGLWLASAGKDNVARIWRWTASGMEDADGNEHDGFQLHATFKGHLGSIGGVALARLVTRTGYPKFLITGSQDLTVKKWTVPSSAEEPLEVAKPVFTRKAHEKDINSVDIAPNDEFFATASQDRTVKIWSVEEGETVGILRGHKRGVWSVKFSVYDKFVVTGSGDKTVKVWNIRDYTCVKTFEGHTNSVLNALFISAGAQVVSAGGDGLVKVWDVKTGECNATLDNHEDKVWSLAHRSDGKVVASGGGDSVITFWEDITEEELARQAEADSELVEKEQELSNFVYRKEWKNAILLALTLDHPSRLLNLFRIVIAENAEKGSIMGLREVDEVLSSLASPQLQLLLRRVRDWNTNARTAAVAQRVLNVLLQSYPPEKFLAVEDIKRTLDALVPYSDRHYTRLSELLEESYIVDYTLRQMDEVLMTQINEV